MPRVPILDDEEYLEVEEAVATTARGRAFLRMRDRRASHMSGDQSRQVVTDIASLLDARDSQRSGHASMDLIQRDLTELRDHIERSKGEIAALVGKDGKGVSGTRLNGATEELYEIVSSTERATSEILGAAEWIQERVGAMGMVKNDRQDFESRCMEIFTACSFQDITGQRIAKVVATMSYVEQRVNTMMSMWEAKGPKASPSGVRTSMSADRSGMPASPAAATDVAERDLLNGPQLPGRGLGQDAVDALFGKAQSAPVAFPVWPTAEKPAENKVPRTETGRGSTPTPPSAPPTSAPAAAPTAPAEAKSGAKATKATPAAAVRPALVAAKLDQSAVDALFN